MRIFPLPAAMWKPLVQAGREAAALPKARAARPAKTSLPPPGCGARLICEDRRHG